MKWVVKRGDITREAVDAIVNAANRELSGGGGVDGAVHRAAGPELARSLRQYPLCPTGDAVVTPGFQLPCRWVIHAVGPVWRGGSRREAELLQAAYLNALRRAIEVGARTVAFAAISAGIYGYPLPEALRVGADALGAGARLPGAPVVVRLIAFNEAVEAAWLGILGSVTGEWPAS